MCVCVCAEGEREHRRENTRKGREGWGRGWRERDCCRVNRGPLFRMTYHCHHRNRRQHNNCCGCFADVVALLLWCLCQQLLWLLHCCGAYVNNCCGCFTAVVPTSTTAVVALLLCCECLRLHDSARWNVPSVDKKTGPNKTGRLIRHGQLCSCICDL